MNVDYLSIYFDILKISCINTCFYQKVFFCFFFTEHLFLLLPSTLVYLPQGHVDNLVYVFFFLFLCTQILLYWYICIYMFVSLCLCVCICVSVSGSLYTHTNTYTHGWCFKIIVSLWKQNCVTYIFLHLACFIPQSHINPSKRFSLAFAL